MTTPPTPGDLYAPTPGLTPKAQKDSFWAKVAQSEQQSYVSNSRPALSNALATGTATPDQLQQIATFVRALDVAKTQKMNQLAGINVTPGTEAADLLNSVGESPQVIARLHGDNSTAQDSQNPSAMAAWFSEVGKNVADNLSNSGDLIFPQSSNANPDKNPDGSSPNWFVNGLSHALSAVANVPGWLYRTEKNLFETTGIPLLNAATGHDQATTTAMQQLLGLPAQQETEKRLGYDPNNLLSNMAFAWSQGHAAFNNLDGVVHTYGQDKVNAALNVFDRQSLYKNENDALTQYVQDLQAQASAGKITPDQFAEQVNFLNSKEFADVYHAVDMQHQSIGRDFAHLVLPDSMQHADDSGMFTFISGGLDAGFDMLADPTIVGGKVVKAFQLGKYALEAFNATKAARILGITDKVTGAVNKATALGGRVQAFLDQATKVRTLAEQGDTVAAAAEHARMVRQFNDMTPFIETVNGKRLAITPEQRAEAEATGTTIRIGSTDALAVKADPITTLDQFHEMLVNEGGLARFAKGVAGTDLRIMPGKVGIIQRSLAKVGADKGTIAGAVAARGVAKKGAVILDYLNDADKITPSDWSELLQKIAKSKGTEQFEALQGQLGIARKMRATAELATRRMTSLLPGVKTIAFNSDSSGAEIERFVRLSLPKYQASILRYLWDHEATSDATRRAIGRGIVNTVAEAAGLTRSVPGRELLDNWNLGMDELDKARYGWGDADKMATIDGGERRAAMNISQLETHLELPSFDQMRIIAAKAAILGYDSRLADGELGEGFASWFTNAAGEKDVAGGLANMAIHPWRTAKFGLLNSAPAMRAMSVLKMGWLLTSANMLRQYLEEYTGIAADGGRRTVLRAGKRYMALNNDANRFIVKVHTLIPSFRRHMVVTTDDAGREIIKSKYRMVFGGGTRTPLTDAEETAVAEAAQKYASPDVMAALGARQAGQLDGIDLAVQSHRDGVLHMRVGWDGKGAPPPRIVVSHTPSHFKGYVEDELNGDAGRAALSDMYGRMFHDEDEPALRALAYLAWNQAATDPKFLAGLSKADIEKMHELVPVDDKSLAAALAGKRKGITPPLTDTLKEYVATDPRTARFRQLAERLNTDRYGQAIKPGDDVARAEAVEDYVHSQIANVAAGVYRADGKTMHAPLVSQLLTSKVPSAEELQKFSLTNLPAHVIRAEFEPAPLGNVGKFGQGITQVFSSAFDKIVTNPMYRLIRKPLFTGMYVNRRVALMPWEKQLVEEFGWKPEEAKTLMSSLAEQQALQDTIRYIDNPAARSQFSVIAQNVWLFYRAQEDWARRWGRILKEDPTLIRKAHMAIMAGVHGGMLDKDADGNLIFTYPGSGAVTEGLMHVANLIEGHPGALVPHVDDLTSKVTWLNPALMNPLGFSASPAVSIPVDFLSKFIPGGDLFRSQADLAMNGQQGNGRAYWEQFFPSALRRLIQLTPMDGSADNTGSTIGSAAASAITNAAILGKTPDGGDDLEKQKFISNTQTQTLNALLARAAFGFFAPGTPSMPELYGQEPADFSYRAMGVRSLADEFKVMSASMGFENALVAWHDLHPDKMILATAGKTDSPAKGASVDYTFGASQWVLAHKDLFDGPYGNVAAYFIPPAPGQFDQAGFNTMTEIGVRQYKDLSQYYTDIVSKNAVTTWFDSKDDYDAAMAAVTINGNLDQLVKTWQKDGLTATRILQLQSIYQNAKAAGLTKQAVNDAYTQRKTDLYSQYPILHSYFAETQARKDQTRQALNQLTAMVNDPSVNLPDMDGAAKMLVVKDNYEKAYAPLKSQRSTQAEAAKAQLLDSYDQAMQQIVADHPNLKDLYNGVFRYLESSG